jgi:hypothetical protein
MNVVLRLFGSVAAAAVIGAGGAAMATTTAHAAVDTCNPFAVEHGQDDFSAPNCVGGADSGLDPSAEQGPGIHEHPGNPPKPPKCPPGQVITAGSNGKCFRPPAN